LRISTTDSSRSTRSRRLLELRRASIRANWKIHNFFIGKSTIFDGKSPFSIGKSTIFDGKSTIFNGQIHYFYGKSPFFMGHGKILMENLNGWLMDGYPLEI
jgi:hypothetical protein